MTFSIPRLVWGGGMILLSMVALVWMGRVFAADLRFRQIPSLGEGEVSSAELSHYALELENLLRSDPYNGQILNTYASVLARQGEYANALKLHRRALTTKNPHNSFDFTGDMLEKMGDLAGSEHALQMSAVINPTNPEINARRLRLLNELLINARNRVSNNAGRASAEDRAELERLRVEFSHAVRNWGIRAPHDKNSHLLLGNYYVEVSRDNRSRTEYYIQSYRHFLMGLSDSPALRLTSGEPMIPTLNAWLTVQQILRGDYSAPYLGLTFR